MIGIDIPIGLPAAGPRRLPDLEGPGLVLGRRASTLFMTPIRQALEAPTHAEATTVSRRVAGFGISVQAFGLRHRIFEVERWLEAAPWPVVEVHPELLVHDVDRATTAVVQAHRPGRGRAAGRLDGRGHRRLLPAPGRPAPHDVLDAAAVAWTVQRIVAGTARPFPDPPERHDGRPVAIWA